MFISRRGGFLSATLLLPKYFRGLPHGLSATGDGAVADRHSEKSLFYRAGSGVADGMQGASGR